MNKLSTIYETNNIISSTTFANIGKKIIANDNKQHYFQSTKMKFLKGSYQSYYNNTFTLLKILRDNT